MNFSIQDFFIKCDQIRRKLENFIFVHLFVSCVEYKLHQEKFQILLRLETVRWQCTLRWWLRKDFFIALFYQQFKLIYIDYNKKSKLKTKTKQQQQQQKTTLAVLSLPILAHNCCDHYFSTFSKRIFSNSIQFIFKLKMSGLIF